VDIVHIMLALVTAILCSSIAHIHSEDQCNGLYSDYSHHLSSKTPYRYVANHNTEPVNFEGEYFACAIIDITIVIISNI